MRAILIFAFIDFYMCPFHCFLLSPGVFPIPLGRLSTWMACALIFPSAFIGGTCLRPLTIFNFPYGPILISVMAARDSAALRVVA